MRKLVKKYLITLSVAGFILLSNLFPVVCSGISKDLFQKRVTLLAVMKYKQHWMMIKISKLSNRNFNTIQCNYILDLKSF